MSTTNWELIQATNPMEEDLLDLHPHTHNIVAPGFVGRPRRSDCTAGQMDGEDGWWTTSKGHGVGRQQQDLLDTIQGMYWTQHIDQPTRIKGTDTPRILDLVLTNEINMIERIEYLPLSF